MKEGVVYLRCLAGAALNVIEPTYKEKCTLLRISLKRMLTVQQKYRCSVQKKKHVALEYKPIGTAIISYNRWSQKENSRLLAKYNVRTIYWPGKISKCMLRLVRGNLG
jgi:hypothetical protein